MKSKKSFVMYTTWRSFFELVEEPELIKELLFAVFDLAEGKEVVIKNNKVRTAFNAIEPVMREDIEAYEARCEKNRIAAQKRWENPNDMRSHTNALQMDGDNDYDYDNDNDNENDSDNDDDISSVMACQEIPSLNEVIEASHNRGITLSEDDARDFLNYYYTDRKGQINGEPIRNWRNLLKSWYDHILVDPNEVFGPGCEGYDEFLKLPVDMQDEVCEEQGKYRGMLTKATAVKVSKIREAV